MDHLTCAAGTVTLGYPPGTGAGDMMVRINQNAAEAGQTFRTGVPKALGYDLGSARTVNEQFRVGRPFSGGETTLQLTTTTLRQCFAVVRVFPLNQATQHWYTFRIARCARESPAVAIRAPGAHYEGGRFKPCTNVIGFDLAS
jgi:hypothetical protein